MALKIPKVDDFTFGKVVASNIGQWTVPVQPACHTACDPVFLMPLHVLAEPLFCLVAVMMSNLPESAHFAPEPHVPTLMIFFSNIIMFFFLQVACAFYSPSSGPGYVQIARILTPASWHMVPHSLVLLSAIVIGCVLCLYAFKMHLLENYATLSESLWTLKQKRSRVIFSNSIYFAIIIQCSVTENLNQVYPNPWLFRKHKPLTLNQPNSPKP